MPNILLKKIKIFTGSGGSTSPPGGGTTVGVIGSGTLNYVTKFTPNGTSVGNSILFDDGTNIGLGLTSLTAKLHIQGIDSTSLNYALKVDNLSNAPLLYVRNDGNVGIGTANPIVKLHIDGGSNPNTLLYIKSTGIDSGLIIDSGEYPVFAMRSSGQQSFAIQGVGSNTIIFRPTSDVQWKDYTNNPAFGTTGLSAPGHYSYYRHNVIFDSALSGISPTAAVHIKGASSTSADYALKVDNSSNSPLLYVRNDGFVGVNATAQSNNGESLRISSPSGGAVAVLIDGGTSFAELDFQANSVFTGKIRATGNRLELTSNEHLFYSLSGSPLIDIASNIVIYNNMGVGNPLSITARLQVRGISSTSADFALKVDNSSSTPLLYVRNDGKISAPLMQTGNTGLVSGDLYVDTAANILANGDKVVGRKV